MCIAIVKNKGIDIPKLNILKNCWENNPDGAGIMFNNGTNVEIHKGFMTFDGFYKFLQAMNYKHDLKNKDLVIHFRIATSGGVSRGTTHPFPITNSYEDMKKVDFVCEYGFAHNGIISKMGSKEVSDTMEFDKYILNLIHDLDNSDNLIHNLAMIHSSRFAIMTKDRVIRGGDWVEEDGVYYSNSTYKEVYFAFNDWNISSWNKGFNKSKSKDVEEYEYCGYCDQLYPKKQLTKYNFDWLCPDCAKYFKKAGEVF